MSKDYIFVSAGMNDKKKEHQVSHFYLNYGFLGLATLLKNSKNIISVYQGELFTPVKLIEYLVGYVAEVDEKIVFLSIPSFFAVSWAHEFIHLVRKKLNCKIIIGGRWVLSDKHWALKEFANVDIIVNGQAESLLEEILANIENVQKPFYIDAPTTKSIGTFNKLDYSLLYDYKKFSPSIEVSRGCGYGCEFCADKDVSRTALKSPKKIIEEIETANNMYGENNLKFYFEASIFHPTNQWIEEFYKLYYDSKIINQWRCEIRADLNLSEENIRLLSLSGLRVIDIGLESGSLIQLERMHKTKKPKKYLEEAHQLMKNCYNYGILVKINILLYPGETENTIRETMGFLESNQKYIKGLSVYPTIIYGTDQHAIKFLREIEKHGASTINNKIEETGITYLNLSSEITFDKANFLSIDIAKKFMTQQDYFDLKSFGYYPRNFTYSDFTKHISKIKQENLPFKLNEEFSNEPI